MPMESHSKQRGRPPRMHKSGELKYGQRDKEYPRSIDRRELVAVIVIVISRFLQRPKTAKSRDPAYSQALLQNKIERQDATL